MMKGLGSVLLLIGLLGFGVRGDKAGWLVSRWEKEGRMPMDMLTRNFNVHGYFGNYAFIVGMPQEMEKIQTIGFKVDYARVFDPSEDLFVLEFNPKISTLAQRAFSMDLDLKKVLIGGFFEDNIAVVDSEKIFEKYNNQQWFQKTEVIPLKKTPFTPGPTFEESPLYPILSRLEPNPIISELIEDISPSNMRSTVIQLSEGFYTRQSNSPEAVEAQQYIESVLKGLGLKVSVHPFLDGYSYNVCGDIIGKENPDAFVVTGAHYDSRSTVTSDPTLRAPGAVDNASGTAGMIEMARVLLSRNQTFSNSIRFCIWSGEEQGLLGSEYYAQDLKAQNVNVLAYFNADMTGYTLPGSSIIMGMKDRSITEWLLDLSYNITATYVPTLPVLTSPSCCSDYISFYDQGYPSIGYFQNPGSASDYPNYHKENDTYEQNNYEQMRLETQAVLAAVLTFAVPL